MTSSEHRVRAVSRTTIYQGRIIGLFVVRDRLRAYVH